MSAEHDGPDERFEQAFAEAIGRAGGAYDADAGRLVDTGWSYGRRLRRRRRVGTAAGAAALALVGVGGAALGGLLPGQGSPAVVGAAGGASTAPAAPVTGPEFQQMLTELLPQGAVTVGEARGTESDTPQLRLVLDDGQGAVQYLFWIMRDSSTADRSCPAVPTGGDSCAESDLPDGSHLSLYQAATRSGEPTGSKTWSAVRSGNGYRMMLQEWNRKPLENGSPITRTDPPLTPDQLAAVVKDPRWNKVMAAIPDRHAGKPTPEPGRTRLTVPPPVPEGLTTLPPSAPLEGTLRPAPPRPLPGESAAIDTPPASEGAATGPAAALPGLLTPPSSGPATLPGFPTPGS
ncbi:hypothetical protein [Kitasatospora sp. NPDC005856]|uniref:hypothetical protein n=1 Tax=Kitasatospora sp. NPDC005856 TaxID=3154566 RepID=UPI0033EC5C60